MRNNQVRNSCSLFAGVVVFAATLSALSFPNAFAAAGKELKSDKAEGRIETERKLDEARKVRESAVADSLQISPRELTEFLQEEVRAGRATPEHNAAWKELFRRINVKGKKHATAADYENASILAETVGSFIELKRSVIIRDFHITEADLLEINDKWTPEQKGNFSKALKSAANIAKHERRILSAEQAFESALDRMGVLDKYREGCRL